MTDVLEGHAPAAQDSIEEKLGRLCAFADCPTHLPLPAHNTRLYCDEHKIKKSRTVSANRNEREPASVTNNVTIRLGSSSMSKEQKMVAEGATALLQLIPLVLSMTGDEICPAEIEKAIPTIALQLAALSKFHPGLKKFFTPGESTGEMMAWTGLCLALAPVLLVVLTHHGVIGKELAEKLAAFTTLGAVLSAMEDESADVASADS